MPTSVQQREGQGSAEPQVQRQRQRLAQRLPGLESELDTLFGEIDDGDTALICADDEDVVLFQRAASGRIDDVFGLGLWVGKNWRDQAAALRGAGICHSAPVYAADRRHAATVAVLTRSRATAGHARALAGALARLLSYRAAADAWNRSQALPASVPEGPELAAHRARLAVAERVAGADASVARSLKLAQRLASYNIPILLNGETGTGKEVFARAVHMLSHRYVGRFVAVNCASVPESLIESELFGYRPGSFTGAAREGHRGRIMQANGGVLFLDEIGDMPLALQSRLLRVLESREVVPLGSEEAVSVDVQIISATHCDLEQSVRAGSFREDLYYRLCGMRIALPALRERGDRRFLFKAVLEEESQGGARFDPAALDALDRHYWPGNLRELRNIVRVALAFADDGVITVENLPAPIGGRNSPLMAPAPEDERGALLREIERQRWNISAVARKLGVSRNTLYRRMQRLAIRIPRDAHHSEPSDDVHSPNPGR